MSMCYQLWSWLMPSLRCACSRKLLICCTLSVRFVPCLSGDVVLTGCSCGCSPTVSLLPLSITALCSWKPVHAWLRWWVSIASIYNPVLLFSTAKHGYGLATLSELCKEGASSIAQSNLSRLFLSSRIFWD